MGHAANKTRKISYGNTLTGSALTSYVAGNLNRLHISKISDKDLTISKDNPLTAISKPREDEDNSSVETVPGVQSSDNKGSSGLYQRKHNKHQPSGQHSHATSLLHQIYEKKHQEHLLQQQMQMRNNPRK